MGLQANVADYDTSREFVFIKTGTTTAVGASNATNVVTVPHNLGYKPICIAYIDDGTTRDPLPVAVAKGFDYVNNKIIYRGYIDYYVDATNIYIRTIYIAFTGSVTYPVRYYLFRSRYL